MSLKEQIVAEAKRLGFNLVGVTRPDPPPNLDVYESWLQAGMHGEMGYLSTERARQRRADPGLLLPECRSIMVLGIYHDISADSGRVPLDDVNEQLILKGLVASYAWGDDYHDVIPPLVKKLVEFIYTQVAEPVPNRWYTDTGPILERDIAQRAGLGWIGKNTCLINPSKGSYFLLAELLLGIELEPDQPFTADHCGSCTRCLEACPTRCILPSRTIDASKCISYLTIELKGPVPIDLRPQIGNWIFGCDFCQQVCPWNQRFAEPGDNAAFARRMDVPQPDLLNELALSPQEFNRKFRASPVKRTKRRGYLRNVCIALGNLKQVSAGIPLKEVLLHEVEPLVRGHAAWALGEIGGDLARQSLREAAVKEQDSYVLGEIQSALNR
jgi:epoxyqueuosine reductase